MVLLDTNVVSELMKAAPHSHVLAWFDRVAAWPLFISTVSEAELLACVALLPEVKRRQELMKSVAAMLAEDFAGRSLTFDSVAARHYGGIFADRRRAGLPITQADCQIAAVARANGFKLATRNTNDFESCGIDVLNPWNG